MRIAGRILAITLAATLCSCASKGVPAGDAADADGRSLTAKLGFARVYLVHGIFVNDERAKAMSFGGGGAAVPTAIGAALGTAIREASATPEDSLPGTPISSEFYINGQDVGRAGKGQYLAIDLPVGDYTISYINQNLTSTKSNQYKISLVAGTVTYLSSDWDSDNGDAVLEPCKEACSEVIQKGRRAVAKWGEPQNTAKP